MLAVICVAILAASSARNSIESMSTLSHSVRKEASAAIAIISQEQMHVVENSFENSFDSDITTDGNKTTLGFTPRQLMMSKIHSSTIIALAALNSQQHALRLSTESRLRSELQALRFEQQIANARAAQDLKRRRKDMEEITKNFQRELTHLRNVVEDLQSQRQASFLSQLRVPPRVMQFIDGNFIPTSSRSGAVLAYPLAFPAALLAILVIASLVLLLCKRANAKYAATNGPSTNQPSSSSIPIPSLCVCASSVSDESSCAGTAGTASPDVQLRKDFEERYRYHTLSPTEQIEKMAKDADMDKPHSRLQDAKPTLISFDTDDGSSVESSTCSTRQVHPSCLQMKDTSATLTCSSPPSSLYIVEGPKTDKPPRRRLLALAKGTKALLRRNKKKPLVRATAAAFTGTLLFRALSHKSISSAHLFVELFLAASLINSLVARLQQARRARARASSQAAKQKRLRMIRGPSIVRPVPTRGVFRKQRRPSKRALMRKAEKDGQRALATAVSLTRQASSSRLLVSPSA